MSKELIEQLAASQAHVVKLREALCTAESALDECRDYPVTHMEVVEALSIPADDTALREMIERAGEVMRQRSMRVAWNIEPDANGPIESGIRALPGVTLEDLK